MSKTTSLMVLALMMCLFAATAAADTIPISLNTNGSFSGPFILGWADFGWNLNALAVPLSFSPVIANGLSTDSAGNLALSDLGTITLGQVDGSLESAFGSSVDPYVFTLSISFTAPASIGGQQFTADLDSVLRTGNLFCVMGACIENAESVVFDFPNNPIQVNYAGGSFMLSVNDIEVFEALGATPSPVHLTGQITNATLNAPSVPEPGSVLLLGTALLGLGVLLRKKRA